MSLNTVLKVGSRMGAWVQNGLSVWAVSHVDHVPDWELGLPLPSIIKEDLTAYG